jgi:predicted metalloprotease
MGRQSANLEDRRGMGMGGVGIAGGGIGAVILVVLGLFFGVDPGVLLDELGGGNPQATSGSSRPPAPGEDRMRDFVSVVLADTEDTWGAIFSQNGRQYEQPKLVLFSGAVQTACGTGQAASGPFYCPLDKKAYLDLTFFRELEQRFRAPGDFAQAYVIAHEIGHHVQTLLGITERVHAARRRGGPEANEMSVRLELQADCFAGVWAHHADRSRQILESGDVEEGLAAAAAVGDDRIQRQSQGYIVPESFTHGSSQQRVRWFKRGFEDGNLRGCDTFGAQQL